MKVGGLELQGFEVWSMQLVNKLHFPLIAMVDYKGYRVIAQSLLPIDKTTIRYG